MWEKKTDREVFLNLYQEKAKSFYFVAHRIVTNEDDAEEAVYRGFKKLSENFAKYRRLLSDEKLAKMCEIMVKHEALKLAETNGRSSRSEEETAECIGLAEKDTMADHNDGRIDDTLKMLGEAERDILYMQYVLDLQAEEISELTDMEPATVREKILTCENKIAAVLEEKKICTDAGKRK